MFRVLRSPRTVECNLCGKQILRGELRLTANLGSGNFPRHHHLHCFRKCYWKELIQIIPEIGNPSMRDERIEEKV